MRLIPRLGYNLVPAVVFLVASQGLGKAPPPAPPSRMEAPRATPAAPPPAVSAWKPEVFPTLELARKGNSADKPTLLADFDEDGRPDAYFADSCTLVRHLAAGWVAEDVSSKSCDSSECQRPVRIGGHLLIPAVGSGHETDRGTSLSWQVASLLQAPRDAEVREVGSWRIEENTSTAGEFHFTPLGNDGLVVSALMGDDTPADVKGPMFAVMRWDAAQGKPVEVSCWQRTRPAKTPSGAPVCTARPTAALHIRLTPVLSNKGSADSQRAGTQLGILAETPLQRGAARLHCVRTPEGTFGYAFLTAAELTGCPTPMPTVK